MILKNPWLVSYKPNPQARLRLFCFSYAGGGASVFRTWANQLPANLEIYAVQLPGREGRINESLFTEIYPLVRTLAPILLPYLDLPFAFFGHSVGALIAFETIRQLRNLKYPKPKHLFVSSRRAPQIPNPERPIYNLSNEEFIQKIRRYNGTEEAVLQNAELMDLFLPILRADLTINETYNYQVELPLDCSISAFGGLQDPLVNRQQLDAWCEHTSKNFSLLMLPGDHFFLKAQQQMLLTAISQDIRNLN